MKIVIADDLPASAVDLLRAEGWNVDVCARQPHDVLARALADADALVVRSATRVTADLLRAAPRLRAIARAGTGVDNVDVDAATARGILVMNAPGANRISVAELTLAQMLALARLLPAADRSMKAGVWDKRSFVGEELRGKVLGLVGFGRIGQEVARRALAFEMTVLAHDPFIAAQVAADLGVELVSLDALCARADYISLHAPSTPQTHRLFDEARLAGCKPGVRLINTARGDLVDEAALLAALRTGHVAGAALDVFDPEPPTDYALAQLPQVVATPHIAASTREGQELVGVETATALRDFLKSGLVRNAVNFPSVPADEFQRLRPYVVLAERLGRLVAQMGEARLESLGVRYYGELAASPHPMLVSSVLAGLFRAILQDAVSPVNARALAVERGLDVTESQSSRPRAYTSLISVKLATSAGERWVEGTIINGVCRLVLVNGIPVEAPLEGTLLLIANHDQPGVIGEVGTILGRHGINIANFALGRDASGAVGVVNLDDRVTAIAGRVLEEIRAVRAVKSAWLIEV